MIPVKLKLRGINSYKKEFDIDFAKLVEGQLFGIFGPVGSGKSTILEAISLALYGETERLHARDDRNYNLMNLQSDELLVDYTFRVEPEGLSYRFIVQGKRNSRQFEKVNTFDRKAYKMENGEWLPISVTSAEAIIGLSYQNFRRTVIIPQGKFQEFLQLGSKDRTQMLKEIFGLERFDLFAKVASLEKKSQLKKEHLEGQISQYAHLTGDLLKEKKKRLALLISALKKKEKELEKKQKVKTALDQYREIKDKVRKSDDKLDQLLEALKQTAAGLKLHRSDFQQMQKQFVGIEQLKLKKRDLGSLKTINFNKLSIAENADRLEKGAGILEHTKAAADAIKKKLKSKEADLKKIRSNRPDLKELSDIQIWFKEKEQKHKQIDLLKKEAATVNQEIKKISREALAPISEHLLNDQAIVGAADNLDALRQLFEKKKQSLGNQLEKFQQQEKEWMVQVGLGGYARQLSDGIPCPLCGSTHHPDLHEPGKAEAALKKVSQQINKIQKETEELVGVLNGFNQTKIRLEEKKKLLASIQEKEDNAKEAFNRFLESYIWESFGPNDEEAFYQTREKANAHQALLEQAETKVDSLRVELEKNQANLEKYQDELKRIKDKRLRLETENQTLEKGLQILKAKDYVKDSEQNLNQHIYELDNEIKDIEYNYREAEKKLNELEKRHSAFEGEKKAVEANNRELQQQLTRQEKLLLQTLKAGQADILKAIKTKDESNLQSGLEAFNAQLQSEIQLYEQEKEEQLSLKSETLRLEEDLAKKAELRTSLSAIDKRLEQLKLLKNLFKGSGFVDYISSIYLQELCHAANQRFYKLTRQQLKLEITDKNAFIVRDFLNQGRTRTAKTLSGGQTFQAALSLALALAESIRLQSKARQNFFFMDEGFGSQDQEALQLVLNTLKSLRQENRIVGIISHVEELKREIDVFLSVENREETGSHISNSWE